jgi:phage-related minor tail protein
MSALTIGELVGFIELEDKGFSKTLDASGKNLDKLQRTTTSATADMERTVDRAFAQIANSISDGVDPNAAIADLNRLVADFTSAMSDMESEARTGGQDTGNAVVDGLHSGLSGAESEARTGILRALEAIKSETGSLDNDLREDGRKAGQGLADGLESGLKGADDVGRRAGHDVADGVKEGGSKLGGISADWMSSLKGLGWAGAGAAIGGLLMSGISTAIERDTIFADLAVKVGAFGPESERLGRIAGELYAGAYGDSLDAVTEALAKVYQNIPGASKLSDDSLKSLAAHGMDVAQVMDEEIGPVTRAVGQMLKTHLAKNAEEAFNILTRGQQSGVNSAEDLLDTFSEYSTIFRDLGLSGKDALGLMSQGLKAGARDSDTVADGLKELDIRVKDMSAAPALKKIGLAPKEMAEAFAKGGPVARHALDQILDKLAAVEDPAKRSQLAVQLFGTKAEDMAKSINNLNLDKAKTAVGGFKDAVDKVDTTLGSTAASSAESWSRSWENTLADIGDKVMKAVQDFLPSPADLGKQWDQVTSWFSGTVGPFFSSIWTSVKDKTVEIWNNITTWLSDKGGAIVDTVKDVPSKIGNFFSSGWESVKSTTSEKWNGIKSAVVEKGQAALDWVKGLPGKVVSFFASGWDSVRSTTSQKWESIKTAAITKGTELLTWVKSLPGKIKSGLGNLGSLLLGAGHDLINGLINGIKAEAGRAAEAAKGVVSSAVDAAKHLLGIASPSKVFIEIGRYAVMGLAQGFNNNQALAITAAELLAQRAGDAVRAALSKTTMEAVGAALTSAATAAAKAAAKPSSTLMAAGSAMAKAAKAALPQIGTAVSTTARSSNLIEPLAPSSGSSGVTVLMPNAVIREAADIGRIGAQVGFELAKRG